MAIFTIVNPYVGHGVALVSGDDDAATEKVAQAISTAIPHAAPVNRGETNSGQALGDVVSTKGGVTVRLFETATDDEAAAVRRAV